MNRNYFHTIDALRFFAFLAVFLGHIPTYNQISWHIPVGNMGTIGVNFFFVLSGFLITYLLVKEKLEFSSINLKLFFIRRILRTWPLYFLLLLVLLLIPYGILNKMGLINQSGYSPDWIFSFSFLENYKIILNDNLNQLTPVNVNWSLCIEEHFYLLFPFLIKIIPVKRIPASLLMLILLSISAKLYIGFIFHKPDIIGMELITCLDLFSFGGIVGYFIATGNKQVSEFMSSIPGLYKRVYLLLVIAIVFSASFFSGKGNPIDIIYPTIQGILFALLISIFVFRNPSMMISEKNILSYFGKISYGLYLFHVGIINCLYLVFVMLGHPLNNSLTLIAFILIALSIIILVSHFSYLLIESPILGIKNKYFSRQRLS